MAEEIQTSSDVADDTMKQNMSICRICLVSESKYTCPRCNIAYCSVTCYKSEAHLACSEPFYKDWVVEQLQECGVSGEDKEKVLEMLSRVEAEEAPFDSYDDDVADLHDRLDGIDLNADTETVWERLTPKEQKEFQCMLEDGRLGQLVEVWTPWWSYRDVRPVKELSAEGGETKEKLCEAPAVMAHIPDVCTLLKHGKPSSDVRYNIMNALYSYIYMVRLHNGGHHDTPHQSAQEILSLSENLKSHQNFTSVNEAIHACLQQAQNSSSIKMTQRFAVSVLHDLKQVLMGSSRDAPLDHQMSALSDLLRLLQAALKMVKKKIRKSTTKLPAPELLAFKQEAFLAGKKVEFFLSWTQRFGMALHGVVCELDLEYAALSSDLADVTHKKEVFEKHWGGKTPKPVTKKIQEL